MNTYEVFLKKPGKDEFRHAGTLDAPDPDMALMLARETHSRRGEGSEMWLVDRNDIAVGAADHLAVTADQPHRHNDGTAVAARRKEIRDAS